MTDNNYDSARHSEGMALFQPISHPILYSVDPIKVAKFIRDRERYEIEVNENAKEVDGLTVSSYRASVDPGLLRRMHFLGKFKKIAPNVTDKNLSDNQIK